MLTPETLAGMSPAQLAEALDYEARHWYGTERYKTAIARDFGYGVTTIHDWKRTPQNIPPALILCLSAWNAMQSFKVHSAARVQDYAGQLSKLALDLQS